MFKWRRAAAASASGDGAEVRGRGEQPDVGERLREDPLAREHEAVEHPERTLDTICSCGHTRRDHTGTRMASDGRCLECGCEEFEQIGAAGEADAQLLGLIRSAIAQVERLQELAIDLRVAGRAAGDGREQDQAP